MCTFIFPMTFIGGEQNLVVYLAFIKLRGPVMQDNMK